MVPAGSAVDETLAGLVDYLERGDIVIDGGNSYFKDTIRRQETLKKIGVHPRRWNLWWRRGSTSWTKYHGGW